MPNACLKKTPIVCIFVVLCHFAGAGFAAEMAPDRLLAEVTNITYSNNDEYLVEITLDKRSGGALDLEKFETSFSAQSEVLGQWIVLDRRIADGPAKSTLPGGGKEHITEIVTIPLVNPHLFRNHEGDVNVRFRYMFKSTGTGSSGDEKAAGESVYWVTPRSDRWVLREGM